MPDQTRDELAARAARTGRSLQEYLRAQLIGLARRTDPEVWIAQIRDRKARTASRIPATKILKHRDVGRR